MGAFGQPDGWMWRRLRNQGFGWWQRMEDGVKFGPVPLDENGRAAWTPEKAMEMQTEVTDG